MVSLSALEELKLAAALVMLWLSVLPGEPPKVEEMFATVLLVAVRLDAALEVRFAASGTEEALTAVLLVATKPDVVPEVIFAASGTEEALTAVLLVATKPDVVPEVIFAEFVALVRLLASGAAI